jgi:exodeoxyribonuclease V beta subunit
MRRRRRSRGCSDLGARGLARIEDGEKSRQLGGGDIAVLVRSHRQAHAVRDALSALGIASVQRGSENVFATREAEELERVLAGIAEPGRETLIGAALATEMMGVSGQALHALRADERQWEAMTETFREAHRAWHEAGFVRMLRAFLERHGVLLRLLEYSDGERRRRTSCTSPSSCIAMPSGWARTRCFSGSRRSANRRRKATKRSSCGWKATRTW